MTEIIKTKTTTYKVMQIGLDFLTFDQSYRKIRGGARYKGFQCFACNRRFVDGEKISLVITNKGNKVICRSCAEQFNKELKGNE